MQKKWRGWPRRSLGSQRSPILSHCVKPLRQAIRTAGQLPLRAIGSGGSLTGAHARAALHQRDTGHLATVATPLEAVGEPLGATVVAWLLSAGGGNIDVAAAAKSLIPGAVLSQRRVYGEIIVQNCHALDDSAGQIVLPDPLCSLVRAGR